MGKWVVLLIAIFGSLPAFAADFDVSKCVAYKGQAQKIFRDKNRRIRCISFGGKAVEYIYNDTKQNQVLDKKTYVPWSLMGKKFHNFQHIQLLPNRTLFLPYEEVFFTGVVYEQLMTELPQVKTLETVLNEFFPDQIKRTEFLDKQIQNFFKSQKIEIAENYSEMTTGEKLQYLEMNMKSGWDRQRYTHKKLSAANKKKIRNNLNVRANSKLSIAQCNPTVSEFIRNQLKQNGFYQNDLDLPLLAHTTYVGPKPAVIMGNILLNDFYNVNGIQTEQEILAGLESKKYIPKDTWLAQSKNYYRTDQPAVIKDISKVLTLSRVVLHETGHVLQLYMSNTAGDPFRQDRIRMGAASILAYPQYSRGVPKKLRKKINKEILEKYLDIIEYGAESFFMDAAPCIL